MTKTIVLHSTQALNLGNSYTYTVTAADKTNYSAFMVTTGATITISDGTNPVVLTLAANEEVILGGDIATIVGTADNTVVFLR